MANQKPWTPLEPPVPRNRLPRHIGIIMDGNGRWAQRQGLVRVRGHEAGAEGVREVVRYASRVGVKVLTLYAFSTENWQRPRTEVTFLMNLLTRYLDQETAELHREGVRITAIGHLEQLPAKPRRTLQKSMELTKENGGLTLCLALNYGSHAELADAARRTVRDIQSGLISERDISSEEIEKRLFTRGFPPVDLLIRTAGEQRISNFLLWQAEDAVFHGTSVCWPEFGPSELEVAIKDCAEQS